MAFPHGASAQTATSIRLGTVIGESYANALFAQEMGFFKQAGLEVQIDAFASGGTIAAAVSSGALDIGASSTASASNAHVRGIAVRIIAPGGVYHTDGPTTVLAVTKNSLIRTAKDLAGKTVAVTTLRDLTQVSVMAWLDKNGGDAKATQFVELAPSAMGPAVIAERTDAAFIGEPWVTQSRDQLRIIGSPYDAIAKRFLIIGWLSSKDWLDRNTALAKRFVSVIRRTNQWASRNLKDTLPILAKYTKIPVETLALMNHNAWVPDLDPALVQPVIDACAQYQVLPHGFAATDLFYPGLT